MREIKFRALDRSAKRWEVLSVWELANSESSSWTDVDMETLCQFIGIQDKNGVEIYENDIIEDADGYTGVVKYTAPGFTVYNDGVNYWVGAGKTNIGKLNGTRVVGNVFENPELVPTHSL